MSDAAVRGAASAASAASSAWADAGWIGMAVVIALGLNLRPILTTIGPLLAEIRSGTGLGLQGASLLTVIPVLCMGSVALFLPWLARWLPEHRGVACSLLAIAGACAWRLWAGDGLSLIASAALAGTGVAIVQALVPGIVKRWFPRRVPMALGLYSASLMAGGGLAATLSPRIAHLADWHVGLGVWAVPALAALMLWTTARPREAAAAVQRGPVLSFFGNRRAWLLAVYFGVTNGGYTSMIAWLPMFYRQLGWSAQDAGGLIGVMTMFQVLGAFTAPVLARRWPDRRPWLLAMLVLQLGGCWACCSLQRRGPRCGWRSSGAGWARCSRCAWRSRSIICPTRVPPATSPRSCRASASSSRASFLTSSAGCARLREASRRRGCC